MTVKEIIKNTAAMIGREDVIKYLEEGEKASVGKDTLASLDILTRLLNLVVNELACSYIPMVKVENADSNDGKIYHKDLSETPLRILGVYDEQGKSVDFAVDSIYTKTVRGKVKVEYSYLPTVYGIDEEIGYSEKDVSISVLCYGLAAEFAVSQGLFDEAVTWHGRYADGVAAKCLPKNKRIKNRRFV